MDYDDELDPALRRAVMALKARSGRPLSVDFTDRVLRAALREPARVPSSVDVVRRLLDVLFRPRMTFLRPAWGLAAAAAICLASVGGTWWIARLDGDAARNVMVRFAVKAPGARTVSLAGDFNRWETEDIRLVDPDGDGVWQAVIPLTPGVYQYMFVLDGETWIPDPAADDRIDDGFGQENSLVRVERTTHKDGGRYRAL